MFLHTIQPSTESTLDSILPFNRYAQRLLEGEPELRTYLLENLHRPFLREEMRAFLETACPTNPILDETSLHSALRKLRKRVILRLAARDLAGMADLTEVMVTMTNLAEIAIQFALTHHQNWLTDPSQFGTPIGEKSVSAQQLLVVAMGKLGGGELNVSSDVDLIFIYPEDGETNGKKSISNHNFFARLGRKLIASLNDYTVDGYVFRVDMRLRPHGENSPLAISFAMLEDYFISQGREWERHAWLKSRVIAGPAAATAILMEEITRPFVFRKYLDFEAYEAMRRLHAQLRKEVDRREMHDNIKLGPGGIREIEFITQVFQLIRGGRDADLCIRPTLTALQRLQQKQPIPAQAITELIDAYRFLRKLEHRLQYLDDQQTQNLPDDAEDQELIAAAMGYAHFADFLQQLDIHRNNVTRHFELIFAAPRTSPAHDILASFWQAQSGDSTQVEAATTQLTTLGFAEPEKISVRIQQFYGGYFFQQLPPATQQKIKSLMPILVEAIAQFPPVEVTLERMLQLLKLISQHAAYLALLREHPQTLPRVTKLVSSSQWASDYLGRHPILLDQLLTPRGLYQLPDWPVLRQELARQLNHADSPKSNITEWQMDVLRHFQHAQVFRLLAIDLEGKLLLETLSDHLTELADLMLDNVLNLAWRGLKKKHREQPAFAIIGYGKLGGKELGYASDLDIVFLFKDSHPDALEIYTKLGQSINTWLTSHTSAGVLYETDLRLRPDGASGLLACSIEAFAQYQHEQAWVWEHQALTRARFVTGDRQLGKIFEQIRKEILCEQRDLTQLRQQILLMREKMLNAHPNPTALFDIKHDRGGIIDVEFMVQYLVLGYAHVYPQLTGNIGNIALLKLAGELALIPAEAAQQVLTAYREFRRLQHRLRLSGDPELSGATASQEKSAGFARIEADDYLSHARLAVLQLWEQVFGG
ncbi:bifunctional [glutamate--ammonia ligase]-adenylyl-L-tyrosine phosphorylase/[glutamate--ammonia-ligase] adenylyltransferase [Nitrosomonas communis]|uniref:bifunctional [glutamate--ammonia ligase]-adenylyl-L-tyrosine phosphorylase/[glutamate--ammonia-ligase] adenylyltransferase n=1 Tax=Nitrosomonas communis TaxID=44574 RepID=UPI0026E993BA|nr:bifunctional [glutamate--ammonia ligase]-adenylyl-L-tyrosine phosphorylase/[glutamate--ammonia-ligase] adenylyltransferase [Nitrosomonas communis]MCO6427581.1 bifunctional [glutamate--ammonia ligase]-adenylyl-L-tyrosine phosphorylase/[glutamate--ammonia-ligase] adenylyltransferase [Nitrosomonas communis]